MNWLKRHCVATEVVDETEDAFLVISQNLDYLNTVATLTTPPSTSVYMAILCLLAKFVHFLVLRAHMRHKPCLRTW